MRKNLWIILSHMSLSYLILQFHSFIYRVVSFPQIRSILLIVIFCKNCKQQFLISVNISDSSCCKIYLIIRTLVNIVYFSHILYHKVFGEKSLKFQTLLYEMGLSTSNVLF